MSLIRNFFFVDNVELTMMLLGVYALGITRENSTQDQEHAETTQEPAPPAATPTLSAQKRRILEYKFQRDNIINNARQRNKQLSSHDLTTIELLDKRIELFERNNEPCQYTGIQRHVGIKGVTGNQGCVCIKDSTGNEVCFPAEADTGTQGSYYFN
jgi:hypothetical protein